MAAEAPDGQVILAGRQTAGRGRMGRSFVSPAGTGVYLSMLLRPTCSPAQASTLTAWAAVAVRRAIAAVCGVEADIKWVNDLQLNGKKICGILTEAVLVGGRVEHLILGVGINGNTGPDELPTPLRATAGSLLTETGRACDLAALTAALIQALDQLGGDFPSARDPYLAAYRAACITTGRSIRVLRQDGSGEDAYAEAVEDDFSLRVRYADGRRARVASGEVSVRYPEA